MSNPGEQQPKRVFKSRDGRQPGGDPRVTPEDLEFVRNLNGDPQDKLDSDAEEEFFGSQKGPRYFEHILEKAMTIKNFKEMHNVNREFQSGLRVPTVPQRDDMPPQQERGLDLLQRGREALMQNPGLRELAIMTSSDRLFDLSLPRQPPRPKVESPYSTIANLLESPIGGVIIAPDLLLICKPKEISAYLETQR